MTDTPDTFADTLDTLRWRAMSEHPHRACSALFLDDRGVVVVRARWGAMTTDGIERADGSVQQFVGWRPLPTPVGDAAIADHIEALEAERDALRALLAPTRVLLSKIVNGDEIQPDDAILAAHLVGTIEAALRNGAAAAAAAAAAGTGVTVPCDEAPAQRRAPRRRRDEPGVTRRAACR